MSSTVAPPSLTADSRAFELLRKLGAMADPSLRVDYLRAELLSGPTDGVASLLQATAEGADAGVTGYREMLLLLAVALAPARLESRRREAAAAAIARGQWLARSLLVPEGRREADAGDGATRAPPVIPGRTVTLGERKSLARGRVRTVLDRVMHDPHPDVIRILLSNPSIREADILRIASRRPIAAEILREIFTHGRWFPRYGVRFALVQNPYLPTDLGLALVRQLHRQDAETLVGATELPNAIREAAEAELRRPAMH